MDSLLLLLPPFLDFVGMTTGLEGVAGGGVNILGGMVKLVVFSLFGVLGDMRSATGTAITSFSSRFFDGIGGAWDEYL